MGPAAGGGAAWRESGAAEGRAAAPLVPASEDRRPSIAVAAVFRPALARVLADRAQLFGDAGATVRPVAEAHRAASHLLELSVRCGELGTGVFLKVHRPGAGPGSAARARARVVGEHRLCSGLRRGRPLSPVVSTVNVVASYPEQLALVTERAAGERLTSAVRRALRRPDGIQAAGLPELLASLGAWLRGFQAAWGTGAKASLPELRASLEVRIARLLAARRSGLDASSRAALLGRWDRLASEVRPEELAEVPVHGDLCLDNLLLHGASVTVLDFADAGLGHPLEDLVYLVLHLRLAGAKAPLRRPQLAALERSLLDGYGGVHPCQPLFQMALLKHRVCHALDLAEGGGAGRRLYGRLLFGEQLRALRAREGDREAG